MTDTQNLPVHDITACACGCTDEGTPTLDVRDIPHRIRHATVFGALESIRVGESMDLVAPHDPKPLLAQIAERERGAIDVDYRHPGPESWTLRLTRTR